MTRLDDPEAPWWSWHRLERFWVDANFLFGPIPDALIRAWPEMRYLDLQLFMRVGYRFADLVYRFKRGSGVDHVFLIFFWRWSEDSFLFRFFRV